MKPGDDMIEVFKMSYGMDKVNQGSFSVQMRMKEQESLFKNSIKLVSCKSLSTFKIKLEKFMAAKWEI